MAKPVTVGHDEVSTPLLNRVLFRTIIDSGALFEKSVTSLPTVVGASIVPVTSNPLTCRVVGSSADFRN